MKEHTVPNSSVVFGDFPAGSGLKVYSPVKATSSATASGGKLRDEGVPSGSDVTRGRLRGFPTYNFFAFMVYLD